MGAAGAAAPPCPLLTGAALPPFLIAIELFYHPNNFASDVRNVINEWLILYMIDIIHGCRERANFKLYIQYTYCFSGS